MDLQISYPGAINPDSVSSTIYKINNNIQTITVDPC